MQMALTIDIYFSLARQSAGVTWVVAGAAAVGRAGAGEGVVRPTAGDFPVTIFFPLSFLEKPI